MWILEHRKSTVKHGVHQLVWLFIALIGFVVFECFFYPLFGELDSF
jgi:hypothetical protein